MTAWLARPHLDPGPHAHLVGRTALVLGPEGDGLLVRLDELEWPARLPPFTPAPPQGTPVRVMTVADGVLIVRPDA